MKFYRLFFTYLFASFLYLFCACSASKVVTQKGQSVVVRTSVDPNGSLPHLVRLEVLGEKLIHVSATPERSFADNKSLAVLPQESGTPYNVSQLGDTVIVSTTSLSAHVLISTGEVKFYDSEGKLLLSEPKGGGTQFTSICVDGTKGYSIHQCFDSPSDEAFYGLGQHQSDEFNYKRKNEELYQYNTKVSIPFIVSSRGYGLLMDSYSLCRFGNPRDYAQLHHVFCLRDREGKEGALSGTYRPKKGENIYRREDSLYFENLKTLRNLPQNFPLNGSSVVYEGTFEPRESGLFKFLLYYAGYVRVFVDGQEVVAERWRTAWNPNSYKFALSLQANRQYALRVEWKPDGGESYCGLRVLSPISAAEEEMHSWWSEMTSQLDYYFMSGSSLDEVISGYRTLTGKAHIMPRWAMGYWQSRERYKTSKELLATLSEFRRRNLPIDNIVLDWSYWPETEWGSHDFDAARFPDPKAMIDSVHASNARLMISVWPKFYTSTEHYKQFDERGWIYQQAVSDSLRDWIGPGYHYSFYDAYSSGARRLFWQQLKQKLYPLNIDAWWMDASEPNVRDCTDMSYRKALCGPTALGPSTQYFNAYALMNAEAIYSGLRSAEGVDGSTPKYSGYDDRRVFQLTRSGFAGLQRYATATWSGDIATRWEDFKAQISAGLNHSASGNPYWTMDIGGFCVERRYEKAWKEFQSSGRENADLKEWRELNVRWHQFGAFSPLYRSHGQYPYREPWHIAPETHLAYQSIAYYLRLRYRLIPYIYSLAARTYWDDYTIMRPLIMDFNSDTATYNIGDQYMFGPALMVSPVTTYEDRSRRLYFPSTQGGWYDFYSGRHVSDGGEWQNVSAPYERVPLHVKAGSIVVLGPDRQWIKSASVVSDTLRLYVYRGADASFALYDDDGETYAYERGEAIRIPINYDDETATLSFGNRQGVYSEMSREVTFIIISVSPNTPQPYDPEREGRSVSYDGKPLVVSLE